MKAYATTATAVSQPAAEVHCTVPRESRKGADQTQSPRMVQQRQRAASLLDGELQRRQKTGLSEIQLKSDLSSLQAERSSSYPVQLHGKGIVIRPPEGAIYMGSHFTQSSHDLSFLTNGVMPTYGQNFENKLQFGEGFYITDDQQGARWGNHEGHTGAGELRKWDVYMDLQDFQNLKILEASGMPTEHQWQPTPYKGNPKLKNYIDNYDAIVDTYTNIETQTKVSDTKFNTKVLDLLYLVPDGFYYELMHDPNHAMFTEAWDEYKQNTKRNQ
ncbi:hypothetical protein AACH06_27030 [Ideonella sp. DXS29W]|uniref:MORN repeat-containing protein 5 n=1 Tax=Ideonella lacteola TaxID=2984193 RepID=A0ABU9C067_9BURK